MGHSHHAKDHKGCGDPQCHAPHPEVQDESRRDFIFISAAAMGAVGAAVTAWPFVATLGPAADTLALSTTEVDLSSVQEGQAITVMWRGKPIFIRHRTAAEIESMTKFDADAAEFNALRDRQKDSERVKQSAFSGKEMPQWLIMIGVCTHLGCVPLGQKPTDPHGDYNGWFCPCHGSQYDASGRIRKGPAPENLHIPPYAFLNETRIRIG
jgi:ubiquinol-cytochrome c reductase iron-sulfur subunit